MTNVNYSGLTDLASVRRLGALWVPKEVGLDDMNWFALQLVDGYMVLKLTTFCIGVNQLANV